MLFFIYVFLNKYKVWNYWVDLVSTFQSFDLDLIPKSSVQIFQFNKVVFEDCFFLFYLVFNLDLDFCSFLLLVFLTSKRCLSILQLICLQIKTNTISAINLDQIIQVQKQKAQKMQSISQITKESLLKTLQNSLQNVRPQYVFQLSSKIYPVMTSHIDCKQALFGSIQQYLKSVKIKNLSTKEIESHVYELAEQINSQLLMAVKQIIEGNFFQKIDKLIFKEKIQAKKSPFIAANNALEIQQDLIGSVKFNQPQSYIQRQIFNFSSPLESSEVDTEKLALIKVLQDNNKNVKQLASIIKERQQMNRQKQQSQFKAQRSIDKIKNIIDPLTSAKSAFSTNQGSIQQNFAKKSQKKLQKSSVIQKYILDDTKIYNFTLQKIRYCICGKQCKEIIQNQNAFRCVHCGCNYHTHCMKKQRQSKNCIFCNLKLIIPTKKVHKVLFEGVLKKNKRKHQINFNLSAEDIGILRNKQQNNFRLTVRCFRLKQNTQSFILFPDSAYISLNLKELKQFRPLHKQSSLKYRKDEPITITKGYNDKNKIVISQTPASSSSSDRVQFQTHFLGIYIVQEMSIEQTIKATIKNQINTFNDSLVILQNAFGIGIITEDVSCQVVKIPLICALSTQKITYPIRGLFCRHYQCFDLKNFLMMISSSTNPRWICPLCKAPCYQFVYDCILAQILKVYSDSAPKEVMFYKTGEFKVFNFKQEPIKHKIQNIYDLQIQSKFKRFLQNEEQNQKVNKKKKVKFQIPEGQEVIDLLSD